MERQGDVCVAPVFSGLVSSANNLRGFRVTQEVRTYRP